MAAVQEIGRGAAGVLTDGRPKPKENELELIHPTGGASGTGPGHQAFLERPVQPLDHAVALWVVSRGLRAGKT